MAYFSYAELQAMRSQAHDEARRLGNTEIDLDAVEREIAERDRASSNHPNRRRVWVTSSGTVCLRDEETIREFWVPTNGGYVREIDDQHPGTLGNQVCDRLNNRGATLSSNRASLPDLIRREYRAARAAQRREQDR